MALGELLSGRLSATRVGDVTLPEVVFEPVLMRDDGDGIIYQAGAFPSEDEAQKVLDIWAAEGRREPMCINIVPVYGTADEWQATR
jgi:hypothetical protein